MRMDDGLSGGVARPTDAARRAVRARPALADAVVIVLVIAASAVLYVGGLGFHGDDWGYFAEIEASGESSLLGQMAGLYDRDLPLQQRPVQLAYVATSYWLFGLEPLGYHVVGAVMVAGIALLLY